MEFQDLNNQITVLSLLAQGIPAYKKLKPLNTEYLNLYVDVDIYDEANPKNAGTMSGPNEYTRATFLNGTASQSYIQRVLYYIADTLVAPDYRTTNCNGIYVAKLRKAVIVNGEHIFVITFNTNPDKSIVETYKKDNKTLNQIVYNALHELAKTRVGKYTQALGAMQELWVTQAQKHHIKVVKGSKWQKPKKVVLPKDFRKLFSQLLADITHFKKKHRITNLTYQDIIDFYNEVHKMHVTGKTRKVQEWLFGQRQPKPSSKGKQVLQIMRLHHNFKQAVDGVHQVSVSAPAIQKLIRDMNEDKHMHNNGLRVVDAYKFDNGKPQLPGRHHFIGIHGTNSFSIPTILTDGLLTHDELIEHSNKHWVDNGQALGDGVYMTSLDQASKSLLFSNNYDSKYRWFIVIDVAYNMPVHENGFFGQPKKKDYDFVMGDQVGANNYSEYVARFGSQIKIKYLLALSRDKK